MGGTSNIFGNRVVTTDNFFRFETTQTFGKLSNPQWYYGDATHFDSGYTGYHYFIELGFDGLTGEDVEIGLQLTDDCLNSPEYKQIIVSVGDYN